MIRFARCVWVVAAFVIVLLCCGVAPAVESVIEDSGYFGIRGSISDGTALVGQRFGGAAGNGEVKAYWADATDWVVSANLSELLLPDALSIGADFGAGALVVNGDTAIAAAYRNEVDGVSEAGSVFLFSRAGATWSYEGAWTEALAPGATSPVANAHFGVAGDLDGDRALIVAGGTNRAYVYDRSGGTWDDGIMLADGNLDTPIAAAIDGDVAAVGTFLNGGHVDVWRHDGQAWNHEAQIANPSADNLFGYDVDISGDTLVVSAKTQTFDVEAEEEDDILGAGAVYVFNYDDISGQWQQRAQIEHPEAAANDNFGHSVALEGDRLVIGAPRQDLDNGGEIMADAGAAYVFELVDTEWTQVDKCVLADPVKGQWFGEAVDIDVMSLLVGGSGRTTMSLADPEVPDPGQGVVQLDGPSAIRIPGDANRDGHVNQDDAAILAANWGEGNAEWGMGDFNEDGTVDLADASIMAANWTGTTSESQAGAAVPEPSTIALLIAGLLILPLSGRRSR